MHSIFKKVEGPKVKLQQVKPKREDLIYADYPDYRKVL